MTISKDDYKWSNANTDLAVMTRLTLKEAAHLTAPLEPYIHPYDALPILVKMIPAVDLLHTGQQIEAFGELLVLLIESSW